MGLKLEIKGVMLGGYAKLWSGSECPQGEEQNGHVGELNWSDEEVLGRFVVRRNVEEQIYGCYQDERTVVNTDFKKRQERRVA